MFFKNIASYSKKKLTILNIIFHLIYFLLLVVGPIVIICIKYSIFKKVPAHVRLTGIGLVLFIALGLYGYVKLKSAVEKLPQVKVGQQKIKFTLRTIIKCIPLSLIMLALAMTKNNIQVAFDTFKYCTLFILAAILVEGFFLDYLSAENDLRAKALESLEVDYRKELLSSKKGK